MIKNKVFRFIANARMDACANVCISIRSRRPFDDHILDTVIDDCRRIAIQHLSIPFEERNGNLS